MAGRLEEMMKWVRFTDIPSTGTSEYSDPLNKRVILMFLDKNGIPYKLKGLERRGYQFLYIQEQDLEMVKRVYIEKLKIKKPVLYLH